MLKKVKGGLKKFLGQVTTKAPPTKPEGLVGRRPMKFPYTFSAKIAQFPWHHYIKHNWMYRYYIIAVFASLPAIKVIHDLANSEENQRKWAEVLLKEAEEHAHH